MQITSTKQHRLTALVTRSIKIAPNDRPYTAAYRHGCRTAPPASCARRQYRAASHRLTAKKGRLYSSVMLPSSKVRARYTSARPAAPSAQGRGRYSRPSRYSPQAVTARLRVCTTRMPALPWISQPSMSMKKISGPLWSNSPA